MNIFTRAWDALLDFLDFHWWAHAILIAALALAASVALGALRHHLWGVADSQCREWCQSDQSVWSSDLHACLCFTPQSGVVLKKAQP